MKRTNGNLPIKFNTNFITPPVFKDAYIYGDISQEYNISAATHRIADMLFIIVADSVDELRAELEDLDTFDESNVSKVNWGSLTCKFTLVYYKDTACYCMTGADYNISCITQSPGSGLAPIITNTVIIPYMNDIPITKDNILCVLGEVSDIEASLTMMDRSMVSMETFDEITFIATAVSELPTIASQVDADRYFYHGKTFSIKELVRDLFTYVCQIEQPEEDAEERIINSLKQKES